MIYDFHLKTFEILGKQVLKKETQIPLTSR